MARKVACCCALGLAFIACSTPASEADDATRGPALPGGPAACSGIETEPSAAPQSFSRLSARVVDENAEPARVLTHQVCGFDLCLFGEIDDSANVDVAAATVTPITAPAFKYGMGLEYAQFVYRLPDEPAITLGSVATVRFPEVGSGEPLLAGKPARSGEVSVELTAGTRIKLDMLTFSAPEELLFRAARVPLELELPALDRSLGLELLIATTPVNTTFCPPAKLSIANTLGWPPGSRVELFVHGVELAQRWAPYGGWSQVSEGAVSSDGARIETDPEGGIPTLSVFGIRRK